MFDDDTIYEFDPFALENESSNGSKTSEASSVSKSSEFENTFRVKLTEFPDFDGRQDSWYKFRCKFEAIAEARRLEDSLAVNMEDEETHSEILIGDL